MSKAAEAAVALEAALLRAVPANKKHRISEAEWVKSLKVFHHEAREIRQQFSLGFLGRARATYLLQQRLIAVGFPADTVRKVIFSMILSSFTGGR